MGLVALSALAAACDATDGVRPDQPSWFRASLQGAVAGDYEGSGEFLAGSDPRAGEPIVFTLNSVGLGTAANQSFQLHRRGEGVPGKGTYALGPLRTSDGRLQGFTAYYVRQVGNRMEAFTARSGQVEITAVSRDRVEGKFRFVGSLYCSRAVVGNASDPAACGSPNTIDPQAASIEVSGMFAAIPAKNTASIAR
ncbi:MAG TPA: hypothetical protein VGV85_12650 [Longimicrobiaceae bacterium]|nr:hypothetical protein [Longimicrobiaceae bacterium]